MNCQPNRLESNARSTATPPAADRWAIPPEVRRRRSMRLVLAVCLIWAALSSSSKAAEHCACRPLWGPGIQFDGFTPTPCDCLGDHAPGGDSADDREGVAACRDPQAPASARNVQLYAELANFDRDADADGWQAIVVIRDQAGEVMTVPALATFEILDVPLRAYQHPTQSSLVLPRARVRWSVPLEYDRQGVAPVTLPASWSTMHAFGWESESTLHAGTDVAANHRNPHWSRIGRLDERRYFVTRNVRDRIDFPSSGWLRVRVSIPGQRPLEAIAPIDTRPSVLVDKPWGYR